MPRKRKTETQEERAERLRGTERQDQEAGHQEEDALDAMVRKSIKLHGA